MFAQQVWQIVEIHTVIGKDGLQIKIVTLYKIVYIRVIAVLDVKHLIATRLKW